MKTNNNKISRSNRKESFISSSNFVGKQAYRICKALLSAGALTSREISTMLSIERTSVCGRIKELRDNNILLEAGRKVDFKTNKTVTTYIVNQDFFVHGLLTTLEADGGTL